MRENLVAPADRLVDRSSEMWPGPRRKQPHSVLGAKSTVDGGGACGAGRGGVPGVRFVHAGCRGAAFRGPRGERFTSRVYAPLGHEALVRAAARAPARPRAPLRKAEG
jgi:hypothetical protein